MYKVGDIVRIIKTGEIQRIKEITDIDEIYILDSNHLYGYYYNELEQIKGICWGKVPKGIKVQVRDRLANKETWDNRYFIREYEATDTLMVSCIKENDVFTGIKMDSCEVCSHVYKEDIRLHSSVKIKKEWIIE